MLAWPLPSVRGVEQKCLGRSILFISEFEERGVRKITTGITGLWRPSVHSDVAFWSFDVGSSYHCEADFSPSKGNRASAVSYNQVRSTWLTTEPSIASNATVVYYTQYTLYSILYTVKSQANLKQVLSSSSKGYPLAITRSRFLEICLWFACDSHYCIV